MPDLSKHDDGAPLSEAEHKQRVDAARARWAAAGAGGVAGAAAAYRGRKISAAGYGFKVRAAMAPTLALRSANRSRVDRYFGAVDRIVSSFRRKGTRIPSTIQTLSSQHRRIANELRAHRDKHGSFYERELGSEPEWASSDLPGEAQIADRRAKLADTIKDLRDNAREDRVVPRKAHFEIVSAFQRARRGGRLKMVWAKDAEASLNEAIAVGIYPADTNLKALEANIVAATGADQAAALREVRSAGIKGRPLKARVIEDVQAHTRFVPAGSTTLPGYPSKSVKGALARDAAADVRRRSLTWWYNRQSVDGAALSAARAAGKIKGEDAMHALGTLRSTPVKLGLLSLGALASGISSYYAAKSLNKADDIPKSTDGGLQDVGMADEDSLALRIAKAFRGWKDGIDDILSARQASLHTTMLTDLDQAMTPLDSVLQAGAAIPAQEFDPSAAALGFTMGVRSPLPEQFVNDYRLDRVRELADGQRDAVKAVLLSAAREGANPDEMARRIRQTVGLTAHQAGLVLNYRKQLETLNGQALTRALRDQRYDGVVQRAIESSKPLTDDQVNRFTDAYHRRFLAYRANTIARTEGLRAANNGHIAGVEQLLGGQPGMTVIKTWMATNDSRTRHDHRELNGKYVVGMQTPFVCDDGSSIRWPHDPNADAAQVINCRCTIVTRLVPLNLVARAGAAAIEEDAQNVFA